MIVKCLERVLLYSPAGRFKSALDSYFHLFIDNSCEEGVASAAPPNFHRRKSVRGGTTIFGMADSPLMDTDVKPDFPTAHVVRVRGYPVFLC